MDFELIEGLSQEFIETLYDGILESDGGKTARVHVYGDPRYGDLYCGSYVYAQEVEFFDQKLDNPASDQNWSWITAAGIWQCCVTRGGRTLSNYGCWRGSGYTFWYNHINCMGWCR